jgi:threonine/homoserine/homoserine lactone efflux protein
MSVTGDLLAFAGVMALGQFSPGPDMLLLTRTSLAQGRTAGWWTTAGITTGLCVHAAIAIVFTRWLVENGGPLASGMKWAAAIYLTWLGVLLLRGVYAALGRERQVQALALGGHSTYVRGLLCNLLNPKAVLFFMAVIAKFVGDDRPAWWSAALWGIIVGQGMILWGAYVWFLQYPPFQRGYRRAGPWIDAAFGIGLLTIAVLLIVKG